MLLFFLAVIMVILSTYLLFISGSVTLCKTLQKDENFYYKSATLFPSRRSPTA